MPRRSSAVIKITTLTVPFNDRGDLNAHRAALAVRDLLDLNFKNPHALAPVAAAAIALMRATWPSPPLDEFKAELANALAAYSLPRDTDKILEATWTEALRLADEAGPGADGLPRLWDAMLAALRGSAERLVGPDRAQPLAALAAGIVGTRFLMFSRWAENAYFASAAPGYYVVNAIPEARIYYMRATTYAALLPLDPIHEPNAFMRRLHLKPAVALSGAAAAFANCSAQEYDPKHSRYRGKRCFFAFIRPGGGPVKYIGATLGEVARAIVERREFEVRMNETTLRALILPRLLEMPLSEWIGWRQLGEPEPATTIALNSSPEPEK